MPRRYEAIRDSLIRQGKGEKQAKRSAARIYNATRKKGEPSLYEAIERERKRK